MKTKTYAGIPEEFAKLENSKIVLIPVPYDGTSTWQKGADKGPEAFLNASENMELYDIETDTEVYQQGVFLAGAITENIKIEPSIMKEFLVNSDSGRFFQKHQSNVMTGFTHSNLMDIGLVLQ